MKPRFSASDVASLLGRNPYRTKNESLLKVLSNMPKYKSAILGLKETMGVKNEREIVAEASPSALKAMWKSVDQAVGATSDEQVEKAISTFKQEHVRQVVQETLEGKRAPTCVALEEVVARVIAGQTTIENEMPTLCVQPEVKMAIENTQEHQVLASEIQKRRGTKLEDKAENDHAAATGIEVTGRNFPGRGPRTTEVPWNDEQWAEIHEGLSSLARTIANITEEDAHDLARNVFSTMKT